MNYEYKMFRADSPIGIFELEELSNGGWVMCGVTQYRGYVYYYFKRIKD